MHTKSAILQTYLWIVGNVLRLSDVKHRVTGDSLFLKKGFNRMSHGCSNKHYNGGFKMVHKRNIRNESKCYITHLVNPAQAILLIEAV